jgi:hypothetical protein
MTDPIDPPFNRALVDRLRAVAQSGEGMMRLHELLVMPEGAFREQFGDPAIPLATGIIEWSGVYEGQFLFQFTREALERFRDGDQQP